MTDSDEIDVCFHLLMAARGLAEPSTRTSPQLPD